MQLIQLNRVAEMYPLKTDLVDTVYLKDLQSTSTFWLLGALDFQIRK